MPLAFVRFLACVALLAVLVACTAPIPARIDSVTIVDGDRTVVQDTDTTLEVEVVASGQIDTTVTWTSGDEDIASVAADGTLTSHLPGTSDITATSVADATKSDTITVTVNPPGLLGWTRQFGTGNGDFGNGVATDAGGNVFAVGYTFGALEGANAGDTDAFVRSHDAGGDLRWTRQFGTGGGDVALGVATDGSGNVYVVGYTIGALEGANAGGLDAFVRSYDAAGDLRWTRQFGTSSHDYAAGVATDGSGNVYASGYTLGALEGANAGANDAFIRAYGAGGDLRWTRQFGTSSHDYAAGVATDGSGKVYASGYTLGALEGANAGGNDAFVRSYDAGGGIRWARQFGTSSDDIPAGVATGGGGNVHVVGYTFGALQGASAGGWDAFIRTYGP